MSDDGEQFGTQFSVYQFFPDDSCEKVAEFVSGRDAALVASRLINSLGARLGTTRRVIITDGLDCLAWEWRHGQGITPRDELGSELG
jgi:hypothetical protein